MTQILTFILGAIAGGTAVWFFTRPGRKQYSDIPQNEPKLIRRQALEKKENMEKLREYLRGRRAITNNEAEKLLEVSNATAERYLDELEQEGLLEQVGKIGTAVRYRITQRR